MIQNLDPEKAHGHNKTSILILNICGPSICKPLEIIFKSYLESGTFQLEWKKATVVPFHKNITSNFNETTDRSHFFRRVEKYLHFCYITGCLIFS